jgi:hypothetical protein
MDRRNLSITFLRRHPERSEGSLYLPLPLPLPCCLSSGKRGKKYSKKTQQNHMSSPKTTQIKQNK